MATENIYTDHLQYDTIKQTLISQLDNYAPLKRKHIQANNAPYMNKQLCKAIMTRSRLKNIYTKSPSSENERKYKNQRNYCVNLLRKSKKKYYNQLDITKLKDTKSFWEHTKPLFCEKHKKRSKITLIENDTVYSEDRDIANIFNSFFLGATSNTEETGSSDNSRKSIPNDTSGDIYLIREKYIDHPSILR